MQQRKSKQVLIYFFLLLLLGSITNINFQNIKILNLNKIKVSGLDDKGNRELANKIENLKLKNIFSLNKNDLKNIIEINTLIENYKIFKIYPSTLDIKINKTKSLAKINQKIEAVVQIEISDDVLIKRLLSRGRSDDNEEVIRHRLDVYHVQTSPLIKHYSQKGMLKKIDGDGEIDLVASRIREVLV